MITVPEAWKDFLAEIEKKPNQQLIYVLGRIDSGKTTFCEFLHEHLNKKFRTAYIDCDPGQSHIGPPTTLGLTLQFSKRMSHKGNYLHFVGSTSPRGHLLQTLTGIKKLTEKARALGAQKIIIDSSGFASGKVAGEFQFQVIDLVRPHHLVLLKQRPNDLQPLALNFKRHPDIRLHYMKVSPSVVQRSLEERQNFRKQKFQHYFRLARSQEFNWNGVGLHGMIPDLRNPEKWHHLLIALCGADNFVLTLAIIRSVQFLPKTLLFHSPPFNRAKVASIQFGSIYLNLDGSQIYT